MDSELNDQSFLSRLSIELKTSDEEALVVLPNHRSLHALSLLLEDESKIELTTADDLLQELSGLDLIEPEEAIVTLYASYCRVESSPQRFTEFVKWGSIFLSDINEIDLHLADIELIYEHISEYKEIGIGEDGAVPGKLEYQFRSFWKSLPVYYKEFVKNMARAKVGYRGLIYKTVSELAQYKPQVMTHRINNRKVCWVGVVPGNQSERNILEAIEKHGTLERYIDADRYYVDDENQEAGRLFRSAQDLSRQKWITSLLSVRPYNFNVHSISGQFAQVLKVTKILKQLDQTEHDQTAIILLDHNLLMPLRAHVASVGIDLNFTTGVRLNETHCFPYIMSWIQLHESMVYRGDKKYFYVHRLKDFLSNPLLNQWFSAKHIWQKIEKDVVKKNLKYVSLTQVKENMPPDLFMQDKFDLLFAWEESFSFIVSTISKALDHMAEIRGIDRLGIENDAIKYTSKRLKQILAQYSDVFEGSLKEIRTFLHHQVGYARIPIIQKRNDCVQVIGLLESRMVDYKNLIFLGASDDNLPGDIHRNTHIPFIHRKFFKLPTHYDSHAMVAYHFYRLLQRCNNAHFLFNASPKALTGGEQSRFLLQLKIELAQKNSAIKFNEFGYNPEIEQDSQTALSIKKTPAVNEAIHAFFKRRVSPSAINKFLNSPLEFYYYHVLKIKEEEALEEDMLASTFGSVVHDALEELYKPHVGRFLNPQILASFNDSIDRIVERRFNEIFTLSDLATGKNFIQVQLAKDYVRAFIQHDLEDTENNGDVQLIASEDRLMAPLQLGDVTLNMFGFADRIDRRNGITRIVDYKTGDVAPTELKCDVQEMFSSAKYSKAIQLAFYKWIYTKVSGFPSDKIESCIYSFRAQKKGYMYLDLKGGDDSFMEDFKTKMDTVVKAMLNELEPFEHKSDSKYTTF